MQVHIDTLRQDADYIYTDKRGVQKSIPRHSIEVTIRNDRRRVRCGSIWNGSLPIFDLAVKFSSGEKVWPGSAYYWIESGNVNNLRPQIDKRGHFILAGFFEDFEDKANIRSQHNAVA